MGFVPSGGDLGSSRWIGTTYRREVNGRTVNLGDPAWRAASFTGLSESVTPLKTSRPRADITRVLCQCSAPNPYATRRFAARYCTRRERQARHPQPKAG